MKPLFHHQSRVIEQHKATGHTRKPFVAIVMGGISEEREVSLVSGKAITESLKNLGYHYVAIDQGTDIAELLQRLKPDVVFNALHGPFGEDGCIQGILEMIGIPYTHSNVLSSALCMDKDMSRHILMHHGIRMPEGVVLTEDALRQGDPMPRPYVIKPTNSGSSCGVKIVLEDSDFDVKDYDYSVGEKFLIERYIPGAELTVGIFEGKPLCVTELRSSRDFYDYTSKYTDGVTEHIVPAPLSSSLTKELCAIAMHAYELLGCKTVSRADFRLEKTSDNREIPYLLEMNTQPGFTPLSLVPEQAAYLGITFNDLVEGILLDALKEGQNRYETADTVEKAS